MQKYLPCASVAAAPVESVVQHSPVAKKSEQQHSPVAKISEQDVKQAQAAWASAIKSISKTYLDGDGSKTKVEYTFGYKKNADGKVRIFLHHSSVPFASPAAEISEEEVKNAQAAWANAIKSISKTYLDGGDYKAAAGKAAGELYGYGHTDVLFKPTKAAE
ncbi:unnamed protein product, partial [Symbiodinium microadriaticum]